MATLKKITIAIAFLFYTTASFAQAQTNRQVDKIVKEIAAHNVYEWKHIGIAGSVSQQYIRFDSLVQLASDKQLEQLAAGNANAVVRLYSYQALKVKKAAIPPAITARLNKDHSTVETLNGCIGGSREVAQLLKETIYIGPEKNKPPTQ